MKEEKRMIKIQLKKIEKEFFDEFKKFEESKDYKFKYNQSLEFLKNHKTEKLRAFDLKDCWKGTNKSNQQIAKILSEYLGFVIDFDFYVYQNREVLRLVQMEERVKNYLKIGLEEIKPFDFEKSDNKKIITLIIIDKYGVKEIKGRLVKVEREETLFLIKKGKQRKGYRLGNKSERYFLK